MRKNTFEEKLREEFISILYELAKVVLSVEDINNLCGKLDSLYNSNLEFEIGSELFGLSKGNGYKFRHYYSDILNVFIDINNNRPNKGDVENIIQNIDTILSNELCETNSKKEIKKLYDHLSLEASRLTYNVYGRNYTTSN